MYAKDLVGIVLAVLVPIVTAVVGAAGVAFQDSRASRSRIGRRKIVLDDARAQVAFVKDWWAVRQLVAPSEEESPSAWALSALDQARRLVEATEPTLPQPKSISAARRLALLYPFQSLPGRVLRAGFYALAGLTLTALGASVSQELLQEPGRDGWVNAYLVVGALVAGVALVLRFLAVAVEEEVVAAASRGASGRGFLRRMLLLYRFRRRSSSLVRMLFFAATGVGIAYVVRSSIQVWRLWSLVLLPTYLTFLTVCGAVVVAMRSWALFLERPSNRDRAAEVPVSAEPRTLKP